VTYDVLLFRPHPSFEIYSKANVPVNVPVSLHLNERQVWFLEKLTEGMHFRSPDLVKQWKVSEKTAKRDILVIQEHKLVEFVGSP